MSNNSQTPLWPLLTGVATLAISAILFILKSGILVSVLFLLLGSSLMLSWYYFYNKNKYTSTKKKGSECVCPICAHNDSEICLHNKCACCIIMKNDKIIGHTNNSLQ
jgi:hypothetical protein